MADNPGGRDALSTFVTTAHDIERKGETTSQDDDLKERATTNEIKCEPGEGGGATEQKQRGEVASHATASLISISCLPQLKMTS